jgi:NAD(P)-dependent dehydrogenase (short-subunit alcohol dehydrogenase family)
MRAKAASTRLTGIGLAFATYFAQEGAQVVIADISEASGLKAPGAGRGSLRITRWKGGGR